MTAPTTPTQAPAEKPLSPMRLNGPMGGVLALGLIGIAFAVAIGQSGLSGPILRTAMSIEPHWPDLGPVLAAPTVVQVHLYVALAAVVLGAVLMTVRKGVMFHRVAGWVWVSLMLVTAGSSLFITGLNGDNWSFIHILSGWTLISAPLALLAAKRHQVKKHRSAMMGLFYGGLLVAGALAFIPGRILWNVFF